MSCAADALALFGAVAVQKNIRDVAQFKGSQPDEAAEGDRVEEHEPPGVLVLEHLEVFGEGLGRRALRGVLGQNEVEHEDDGQGDQGQPEDVGPAVGGSQTGADKGGQGGAGVAGAGDAQRGALVFGRIPARGQRQGDGEGCAGYAEEQAEDQHLFIAVNAEVPCDGERAEHDDLADGAGHFRLEVIDQHAHDEAQHRAGQYEIGRAHV